MEWIILNHQDNIRQTLIFLHGLGADGNDFAPIIPEFNLRSDTKIMLPTAPARPITANGGYVMNGWYDIVDFSFQNPDVAGLKQTVEALRPTVEAEKALGRKVIIGGFSQGGAVAYHLGTRHSVDGIVALSTYLIDDNTPAGKIPVLIQHGTHDDIVPYRLAKSASQRLTELGYNIQFDDYEMGHHLCNQQISDLSAWFNQHGF